MADTHSLWGGTLVLLSFDPVDWSLLAQVDVTSGGTIRRYALVMEEVSDFRAERDVPLPWSYAELTEVHVTEGRDGIRVELVLWSENTVLRARCARVQVLPRD